MTSKVGDAFASRKLLAASDTQRGLSLAIKMGFELLSASEALSALSY